LTAQHVSSGIPLIIRSSNCICSLWFPLRLGYGRSPHAYVNQRLQIQLQLLMMSGMPLETCWAVNERWNNKFCYKVASCWLFPLSNKPIYTLQYRCNIQSHQKVYIQNNLHKRVIAMFPKTITNLKTFCFCVFLKKFSSNRVGNALAWI